MASRRMGRDLHSILGGALVPRDYSGGESQENPKSPGKAKEI